ncbi:putative late blight resistance protein homolog R1A-3 isoform X1 [Solanum dulcamara]|uniref:putative late blight resistance protein homolog R1A-3 isoform X1 n=2 Tax=Solanum dulcamara TaxID=45834 RepID=UPI00248566C6|nr:putative late blight resistance protein homolog R1A-3 isoform X1 [Solanum dulcamara]XP_055810948.1 putative late blight resistance protein homolog R1A-3 isoform X1 [Solanum dulcamara]
MEKGKDNEGEREKEEAKNSSVSFSALHKDVVNVLDFMERLKNEEDQIAVDMAYQIENLKFVLAFICTYVQLSYSNLEKFEDTMTAARQEVKDLLRSILDVVDNNIGCKYNNMNHVLPSLANNMDDCIGSCQHSKSNATITDEQLNFLLLNLHHLSEYFAEKVYPYEFLQNVCGNMRDFHVLIVNGCIEHEIVEYVLPQFQPMAERVGLFLWDETISEDSQVFKLAHLFLKIFPIELEVMHICFTNLKTSTSAEVGRFIKKLLETSPDILREYLIHLQENMVNVITTSISGAQNIDTMIEFLLIILSDMPKDFIHHDKLFDLLARVGALTREVSTLVRDLEEKLRNKEDTDQTNHAALDLLENIELLKEDLKHVYLKSPDSSQCCFPMSDGPLFMHMLHRHLNDLLDSSASSIALIKEEIGLVKQDLEFIRSFFVNVEQGLYKDLWARVLDVAYEAKDVIDSIIVRDNGLLHLIFSLPITIKKIKLIKEDISNLLEKIPKNRSLIVVNSPKKPVESKSLTTGKIIVGFEEETNWIIRKLTSGPANLDVISITAMPGSGKTTLAYKVYNDKSVSSHFDLRAWCTVEQGYNEKKLLRNIFNQVSGLDSKVSENIDVADKLRKQLYGKRYLIVLDDVWDTTTWDELTRPFPEVEKGSRIILTTREKEVALHGKLNTDPLNLRLLRSEESWELFEKRAFGKESCPDELLDVGKEIAQNCKGLPLVADLIAGVVARKEKKKTVWLEVRNNLSSFILNSEVEVMKVIELSYDHLPNHLKPCFLYLARFPKDSPVIIYALKDFWRAEGLVEQTEMKSVEEVMKVYLDNLISSSLVILFNEIGDHPTCRLHDFVHDFCLIKARKEKLFDRISSIATPSSSDLMPRIVTIDCKSEIFGLNNFVLFGSNKIRHSGKHLYSLRIIGDKLDDRLSDICHIRHLRLLRVLYLDPSFIKVKDSLLNEICMLNHLRFLCIGTEVKSLPASLSNLWNLETLLVSNIGSTLVLLPRIWDLVKLRVLFMSACSFFDLSADEPILIAEDTKLENLRQLENLKLSYSKDTEDIFKRFPNLQGLAFRLKESWDYSTEGYWFPKLDFLTELEDLRVVFESSNTNDSGPSVVTNRAWDFHFPSSLKSLWLGVFPLTSDSLSTIARLPNLENLTLKNTIIQGEEWNMGEEETFENLKFLELDEVTLVKWDVGEESFPVLEKLVLWRCRKLEEIPPSFGDIYSLKIIKVDYNRQLKDSAMMIKQYVEDMTGEDKLQVHCLLQS